MVAIFNHIKALYRKMSGIEIHSDDIETAVTSTYSFLPEAALMSFDDVLGSSIKCNSNFLRIP